MKSGRPGPSTGLTEKFSATRTKQGAIQSILIFFVLLLLTKTAWAGWMEAIVGPDSTIYIDRQTMRNTSNGRQAWMLINYKRAQQSSAGAYSSIKYLVEFDCTSPRKRNLQVAMHSGTMATGAVIFSDTEPFAWSTVDLQSSVGLVSKLACLN